MAKTLAELERDRDETELECVRRYEAWQKAKRDVHNAELDYFAAQINVTHCTVKYLEAKLAAAPR
jgi:hypothetical protein